MSKHTPGPWMYAREPSGIATVAWCEDYAIGPDTGRGNPSQANYDDHGDAESDARLIAAAPELLALAKQYAGECGMCGGTGRETVFAPDGYPSHSVDCEDCAGIRAVIAKATGET